MEHHRAAEVHPAENGGCEQQENHAEGNGQVLPDDGAAGAAQPHREGQFAQIVGHQGHIGGFQRHGCARLAHGNADGRGGQGRGVVHPVADHRHRPVLDLQFADGFQFLVGQQASTHIGYTHFCGNAAGDGRVIARQHHEFADAQFQQGLQRGPDAGAGGVGQRQHPQEAVAGAHGHGGFAFGFQRGHGFGQPVGRAAVHLLEQPQRANPHGLVFHFAAHAAPADVFHLLGHGKFQPALAGGFHHGLRQRVAGALLYRAGHPQQRFGAGAIQGEQVGDGKFPLGEGARFVEGHHTQRAQVFQMHAAFDQHAVPRGLSDARQHGRRGAQRQGAGRCRHQ